MTFIPDDMWVSEWVNHVEVISRTGYGSLSDSKKSASVTINNIDPKITLLHSYQDDEDGPKTVFEYVEPTVLTPDIKDAPAGATWTWSASMGDTTKIQKVYSSIFDSWGDVRVWGVQDVDSDTEVTTLTLTVASTNTVINGMSETFTIWVSDDEASEKLIFDQASYSWDEDTDGQTIGFKLANLPWWYAKNDVILDPPESLGDFATRTDGTDDIKFTKTNWNEYQYVTYEIAHKDTDYEDHSVTFNPTVTFNDRYYGNVPATYDYGALSDDDKSQTITISNIDVRPSPSVRIEDGYGGDKKLYETEGGSLNPLELQVDHAPAGATWVWSVTNSDSTGVTASITDGRFLWLQFPNDSNDVPDASTVTVTVNSTNTEINGLSETITVWVKDKTGDDLHFDQDSYSWTENTDNNQIGVKLGWWPDRGDEVILTFSSSLQSGAATLAGDGTLTFTYDNWNEYQYVSYTAVHQDAHYYDLTLSSLLSETSYNDGGNTEAKTYSGGTSVTITNIDTRPPASIGVEDGYGGDKKLYQTEGGNLNPLELTINTPPAGRHLDLERDQQRQHRGNRVD